MLATHIHTDGDNSLFSFEKIELNINNDKIIMLIVATSFALYPTCNITQVLTVLDVLTNLSEISDIENDLVERESLKMCFLQRSTLADKCKLFSGLANHALISCWWMVAALQ